MPAGRDLGPISVPDAVNKFNESLPGDPDAFVGAPGRISQLQRAAGRAATTGGLQQSFNGPEHGRAFVGLNHENGGEYSAGLADCWGQKSLTLDPCECPLN